MGAAEPVAFRAKMALPAELVAVIEIYLFPLGIREEIAIILVMAFNASQLVVAPSMVDFDITMGEEDAVSHLHHFIRMADAASESGYGIFAGQHPEGPPLIGFFGLYRLDR